MYPENPFLEKLLILHCKAFRRLPQPFSLFPALPPAHRRPENRPRKGDFLLTPQAIRTIFHSV
jgi:hypothetical protein